MGGMGIMSIIGIIGGIGFPMEYAYPAHIAYVAYSAYSSHFAYPGRFSYQIDRRRRVEINCWLMGLSFLIAFVNGTFTISSFFTPIITLR